MPRLAGKTAIVTGAGSGSGRAIALEFAAQGAAVVVVDRNGSAARETVAAITSRSDAGLAVEADVTNRSDTLRMRDEALARFAKIDILINNAGARCIKGFLEHSEEDWHRMIDINLTAHFLCAQAVLPGMIARGKGKIVSIASIAGHVGRPNRAAYCAAKAGVLGLTRALAMDLRNTGVCVNAISPGSIATPLNAAASNDPGVDWGGETLVGRWGRPEEVAYAAVFLASDESDYVTGTDLTVDGGWLIGRARDGEI
jgi:NAD(P)-dependent dehydrogenase (short-subunit alcohol dehydrogenase family)